MIRFVAALVITVAFASLASACPWCCPCRPPGPVVYYPNYPPSRPGTVYYYYPPPAVVVTEPPAVIVADPPKAAQEEKPLDPVDLYNKVVKSCVYIVTPRKGGFAEGTGSLIDVEQKLVLTSYDVVGEEKFVHVQFPIYDKAGDLVTDKERYKERVPKGQAIRGTVLFRDKTRDLAIVRIDRIPIGTEAIPLAKTSPRVGTVVYQIGNAGNLAHVFRVSKGDVSSVGVLKFIETGSGEFAQPAIHRVTATTPSNPGDSGGPLYDKRSYLVAIAERGSTSASLVNLFIDVTEVRALLKEKKVTIKEMADEFDLKNAVDTLPNKDTERLGRDSSTPTEADERTAAQKLRSAKLFSVGEDNRPTYIAKLKEVVAKWPNTAAGKEAKKLLDALKVTNK